MIIHILLLFTPITLSTWPPPVTQVGYCEWIKWTLKTDGLVGSRQDASDPEKCFINTANRDISSPKSAQRHCQINKVHLSSFSLCCLELAWLLNVYQLYIKLRFSKISISANWIKSLSLLTTKVKTILYPLIAQRRCVVIGNVGHSPLDVTIKYNIEVW